MASGLPTNHVHQQTQQFSPVTTRLSAIVNALFYYSPVQSSVEGLSGKVSQAIDQENGAFQAQLPTKTRPVLAGF